MEQRLSLITLGVRDLVRSRTFYSDGLGWVPSELSNENVVFCQCAGVVFGLYGRDALAEDAALDSSEGSGFRGITLAYNARTRDDVDDVVRSCMKPSFVRVWIDAVFSAAQSAMTALVAVS